MNNIKKQMQGVMIFLTVLFVGYSAEAAKVWTTDNNVINAKSVRFSKVRQEYIITMANNSEMPLPASRVKNLEVDKPAQYDQAVGAISSGALDQAIPLLDKIILEYYMLPPWDGKALDMLGFVYSKKGDNQKAATAYKKLFSTVLPSAITLDMQRRGWSALIAVNDSSSLTQQLDAAIAKGSRENAAAAHLARGDMAKAQGNKTDALLDFLRVVILYDQVKTFQAEALYKTAQLLDELRDPRAEEFRKRLMQDWPQSEWASKK